MHLDVRIAYKELPSLAHRRRAPIIGLGFGATGFLVGVWLVIYYVVGEVHPGSKQLAQLKAAFVTSRHSNRTGE